MNNLIRFLAIICCLCPLHGMAQGRLSAGNSLTGKILDEKTNAPIAGASVFIRSLHSGVTTNENGVYQFARLEERNYTLEISIVGYKKIVLDIYVSGTSVKDFVLATSGNTMAEVVVTGVSRATLIRENPVSISSVSAKAIEQTIQSNVIDVLVKNVPGLNAVKTGPNISKPFIRGLGYNRVLTLYDGMRQEGQQWGDEHGIEADAYNIERAEVIKGPASLMFGSDALAGVVSLFPYIPKEKDGIIRGKFTSEYQSNNGLIGNGIRISYSNQHWLLALRGSYRIAKNYSNKVDGPVYNTGFDEKNASALIGYNSRSGYSHLNFTLYDNLQGIPDGSRDSLSRKFTKQVLEGAADDIINRPVVSAAELHSYTLSPLHQHIQHYRMYSNNHYKLNAGDVDISLGLQQNVRREYSHPTAPDQAGLFVRLNTMNYGIKYIAPLLYDIEISAGINGMYQNNKSRNATDFPIPDYHLFDAGAYTYAKWKNDKLTISGGIRYDRRTLNGNNFYVKTNPANGFNQQAFYPDTAGAVLQFPVLKKTFTGISLSIGAAYQLSEQISLKGNIARGYRSPNITEIASNGLDPGAHIIYLGNRNFVPEFSFQQDIEFSGNFRNLRASLSLFNNNIQDYIYLTQLADAQGNALTDAQGNKTFQYQQGAARLYGMEASLDVRPIAWKGFEFCNNFAVVYGINKNNHFKDKGINGEYLPLIPAAKLLSSISQEIKTNAKVFTAVTIKTEVEYNAAQHRFLALFNTETATPGFTIINVSAVTAIQYSRKHSLQFQIQAGNLFDVVYQSNLSRLKYFEYYSQSPNGRLGMYGMGRNICLKLVASF